MNRTERRRRGLRASDTFAVICRDDPPPGARANGRPDVVFVLDVTRAELEAQSRAIPSFGAETAEG